MVSSIGGWGVAVDGHGNLFVSDGNANIQRVSSSGAVATVAGNGIPGYSGDGGAAINAQLSNPSGVAVDSNGNLFIADRTNFRIRKVSTSGAVTSVRWQWYWRLLYRLHVAPLCRATRR